MRVIFSRKGFDSSYGGGVSPILPDGTMVTIPIPERGSGVRYADLATPRGSMLDLMLELGIRSYKENKSSQALDAASEAHLDPDLLGETRDRHSDWRPVFGQCDAAQSVLSNRGVSSGDLFIFYGTFRHATLKNGSLKYAGKPFHVIFGYMSVGDIVYVNSSTMLPWCSEHPHLINRSRKNNTLYVAADSVKLGNGDVPGAGILLFDEQRVLSHSTDRISLWKLPRCFHPTVSGKIMSSNRPDAWSLSPEAAFVQTKSPGQEYVIESTGDMRAWASAILTL